MTWHVFGVGGPCEGMVEQVIRVGGHVPPGWSSAWVYEEPADDDGALQSVEVFISLEDRERLLSRCRRPAGDAATNEALRDHIDLLSAEQHMVAIDALRARLRQHRLPREWVENAYGPTQEQWARLDVDSDGLVGVESLARTGCVTEFGLGDCFPREWIVEQREFEEAREGLESRIAAATAPYRRYLEDAAP